MILNDLILCFCMQFEYIYFGWIIVFFLSTQWFPYLSKLVFLFDGGVMGDKTQQHNLSILDGQAWIKIDHELADSRQSKFLEISDRLPWAQNLF